MLSKKTLFFQMELGNCRNQQGRNRAVIYKFHQRKTTFCCLSNQYHKEKTFQFNVMLYFVEKTSGWRLAAGFLPNRHALAAPRGSPGKFGGAMPKLHLANQNVVFGIIKMATRTRELRFVGDNCVSHITKWCLEH
jgi:hypothetical protein